MGFIGTILTQIDTTAQMGLWKERRLNGKKYRYVYNNGATTLVAGYAVYHNTTTKGQVTCVCVSNIRNRPAGIAISAIPNASYGWIQVSGRNTTLKKVSGQSYTAGQRVQALSNATGSLVVITNVSQAPIVAVFGTIDAAAASGTTAYTLDITLEPAPEE